ncbi:MAG: cyclopropane-fatty-acyl-phospholipid synthase family protein [Geminicoccaceae bacterium]|nr:cyclopropane-fatty-acyl-phospholipid synthase family protein [Geminicoccaceae bacterium]
MDGSLTIEQGTLYDFLSILMSNEDSVYSYPTIRSLVRLQSWFRSLSQFNPVPRARFNARHHYDLPVTFYELFLDRDYQYSCAYFTEPHHDLEQAQFDKKRHIAAKLLLAPGQRVLDIGSGWGGLAIDLARQGCSVLGVSLAEEQIAVSRRRALEAGLADRVEFAARDYRELDETFDRIVSVGMFEHVGVNHYPTFFRQIRKLLHDDGVALVHSIGRMSGPGTTNPWIRKYIFPGGYSPALSEVLPVVEQLGLWVTDVEILRLHYASTLRLWRQRFATHEAEVRQAYGERFCRMWEFYLVASELAFRHSDHMVFQLQLAKRRDAVPLTRDYMLEAERDGAMETSAIAAE